ncbi:hypothetical protein BD769DRAFT_1353011 [Suillus cothurnatus]|nr:hypothetical protein BD769DRAFT_1369810 [Suillus cothurnatus]KAG2135004.1 hypothetical protein BD769DRAFT_1353011 [Suillus cothurnatus]
MTAAYAFTDYRSQGQTIPYVLVDIATPPTGGLNLFNLYVALSRTEDDRLKELDEQTKVWWAKMGRDTR